MGNDLYALMDLLITVAGLYVVYQYVVMITSRKIKKSQLLPKDIDVTKCTDPEGYIRDIGLKQLGFGVSASACGIFALIQDFYGTISMTVSMILTVIFLVFTVLYGFGMKKAMEKYWGRK